MLLTRISCTSIHGLNSMGGTRDFITLLIIKLFYFRKLKITIKTHGSDTSVLEKTSFFYRKLLMPFLRQHVDAWFFLSSDEKELVRKYDPVLANKIFITANIIDPGRSVASTGVQGKNMRWTIESSRCCLQAAL